MDRPNIEAERRTERGKNAARRVRQAGRVPGVLYGAAGETISLLLDPRQLLAALRSETGQNTLLELHLKEGETGPAMIVQSQFEPVRGRLLHVDLKRIAMDRKLKVSVPIVTTGEPKGVKTQGGILEVVLRAVEVECFPNDIPERIPVAVDELVIGEAVRVADLQKGLGENVLLLEDPTVVICHVVHPKMEEVKPAAEAAAEAPAEPELIKKGKAAEEGEEAAEAGEKGEKGEKREKREKKE